MTSLFNPATLKINRNLLFEFFVVFSKFEFALKNSTFLKGDEKNADPDWDRFAISIRDVFSPYSTPELNQACEYLLLNPPMKQVVIEGAIAWSTVGPDESVSEAERLLLYVRRVRNNLFHGGKFSADPFENTERQERLFISSLVILAECLRLSPKVRDFFEAAAI